MNYIRETFKKVVDHYTMDPEWIQEEVARLTGSESSVLDVIFKRGGIR